MRRYIFLPFHDSVVVMMTSNERDVFRQLSSVLYRPNDKDYQKAEGSALFMQRDVFDMCGCGKSCTCDCQPPPRCGKAGWFYVDFHIALQTCAPLSPGLLERWALGGLFLGVACAEMRSVSCCRFRFERLVNRFLHVGNHVHLGICWLKYFSNERLFVRS